MKGSYLIRNGRIIDPENRFDATADLRIESGKIAQIGNKLDAKGCEVIDAAGMIVTPGFVDIHVHLREPGEEGKETIYTGTRAAARGGVTSVVCMPNTAPPLDTPAMIAYVLAKVAREGLVKVRPLGCVSRGRDGEAMTDLAGLKEAGAIGFTDDGSCVMNALLAKRAMINCGILKLPYFEHAEDANLANGGVMHEGTFSLELGLPGRSGAAEEVIVARDLLLAEATGAHLHLTHISAASSLAMIREAKRRGVRVTCDVTPHHVALTDEAVGEFDTMAKVNPPLRDEKNRKALIAGISDGTVDAIASDHAPHGLLDKEAEFSQAAAGISGVETSFSICLEALVRPGYIDLSRLIGLMSGGPAAVMGIEGGRLSRGRPADVAIIDPNAEWELDPAKMESKGRNTPFAGWKLKGRAIYVFVEGKCSVREGKVIDKSS